MTMHDRFRTRPLLSIVAPAFNEEAVLPAFHAELTRALSTLDDRIEWEIIYVDDGSADGTPNVIRQLASDDPRVRFIRLTRNFGNQAAVTAGLKHTRGDAVITLDSDLQHPPALIPAMLDQWRAGYNVVLTVRRDNQSLGPLKRLAVPLFYTVLNRLSGMGLKPAICDYRLLSRKAVDALLSMPERHRFLRGMVHWLGFPSAEIPFDVSPRFAGHSKFTLRRLTRLALDGIFSFSHAPLHAATMLAGFALCVSAVGSTAAWLAFRPAGPTGWLFLSLIAAAHVAGGGTWIAFWAIGEYLGRIHEQLLGRPLYVVRETSERVRVTIVHADDETRINAA